jgi:hypothetical protein
VSLVLAVEPEGAAGPAGAAGGMMIVVVPPGGAARWPSSVKPRFSSADCPGAAPPDVVDGWVDGCACGGLAAVSVPPAGAAS